MDKKEIQQKEEEIRNDDAILLNALLEKKMLVLNTVGNSICVALGNGFLSRAAEMIINLLRRYGFTRAVTRLTGFISNPIVTAVMFVLDAFAVPWAIERLLAGLSRLSKFILLKVNGTGSSRMIEESQHPHNS